MVNAAGSDGRCNTIWYKAVFKGGVYEARETVRAFGGAEERRVASLDGRADVARDRACGRQGALVHSLPEGGSRWVCSCGAAELAPLGRGTRTPLTLSRAR